MCCQEFHGLVPPAQFSGGTSEDNKLWMQNYPRLLERYYDAWQAAYGVDKRACDGVSSGDGVYARRCSLLSCHVHGVSGSCVSFTGNDGFAASGALQSACCCGGDGVDGKWCYSLSHVRRGAIGLGCESSVLERNAQRCVETVGLVGIGSGELQAQQLHGGNDERCSGGSQNTASSLEYSQFESGGVSRLDGHKVRVDALDEVITDCGDSVHKLSSERTTKINNSVNVSSCSSRGVNWDRNQKWKVQRKARKEKRQLMQVDWRVNRGIKSDVSNADVDRSFFSLCSDETKKELRESRAQALVAQNKLSAFNAGKKLERGQAVSLEIELVQQMIKVTKLAESLKKSTKDAAIGGWAETIADSVTRSVAEKAPSSVPSLESVGYGKSALRSSDGSFVDTARFDEYNEKKIQLTDQFEQGVLSTFHYDSLIDDLRVDYADVSMTVEERIRRECSMEFAEKLVHAGVSARIIDETLGLNVNSSY